MPTSPQKITTEQWDTLQSGQVDAFCLGDDLPGGELHSSGVLFPGAFNPLHDGHRQMSQIAAELCDAAIEFEISILNVDKPPLTFDEVQVRIASFSIATAVWLTRAPTFLEKSQLFPDSTFVVGADTVTRIADPRYYADEGDGCTEAIRAITQQGCRFLVFSRQSDDGFQSLGDLNLPTELRNLCDEVPADKFRHDISSTELRSRDQLK